MNKEGLLSDEELEVVFQRMAERDNAFFGRPATMSDLPTYEASADTARVALAAPFVETVRVICGTPRGHRLGRVVITKDGPVWIPETADAERDEERRERAAESAGREASYHPFTVGGPVPEPLWGVYAHYRSVHQAYCRHGLWIIARDDLLDAHKRALRKQTHTVLVARERDA